MRINLDRLKTRNRETRFLEACLETRQPFVVDNTNASRAERQKYIEAAKQGGFKVIGYYFQSRIEDCKWRNEKRPADQQIPLRGILGTLGCPVSVHASLMATISLPPNTVSRSYAPFGTGHCRALPSS
jgi:hypothetical protein